MKAMGVVVLLSVTALSAQEQSPASFEVATVKVAPPRTGTAALIAMDTDAAMVRYSNITLKNLIAMAYSFDSRLIRGGPPWLDDQLYDLVAKLPPDASRDRVPLMLQTLLAETRRIIEGAREYVGVAKQWALRHNEYRLEAEVAYLTDLLNAAPDIVSDERNPRPRKSKAG